MQLISKVAYPHIYDQVLGMVEKNVYILMSHIKIRRKLGLPLLTNKPTSNWYYTFIDGIEFEIVFCPYHSQLIPNRIFLIFAAFIIFFEMLLTCIEAYSAFIIHFVISDNGRSKTTHRNKKYITQMPSNKLSVFV